MRKTIIIVIIIIVVSCVSSKKECNTLSNQDGKKIIELIEDSLFCKKVEIIDCDYVDKEFVYTTDVFRRNYIRVKIIASEIIDSLVSVKPLFDLNYQYRGGVRNAIPSLLKMVNGDSIKFLYSIDASLQAVYSQINKHYDSILPPQLEYFFNEKFVELHEKSNRMKRELQDSLMLISFSGFVETYFDSNDFHITVNFTYCGKSGTLFLYNGNDNKKFTPKVLKWLLR